MDQQVRTQYPLLSELLRDMFTEGFKESDYPEEDYELIIKPEQHWRWPDTAPRLEEMASKLTPYERSVLVVGDGIDQMALIARKGVADLHQFLDDVFDGELYDNFHVRW